MEALRGRSGRHVDHVVLRLQGGRGDQHRTFRGLRGQGELHYQAQNDNLSGMKTIEQRYHRGYQN